MTGRGERQALGAGEEAGCLPARGGRLARSLRRLRRQLGDLTQRLRMSSRRRHRLAEVHSPCRAPATPQNNKKQVLGRTPTKLYSPFGIETPHYAEHRMSPYMPDTPEHGFSPKRSKGLVHSWHVLAKKRPRALFR